MIMQNAEGVIATALMYADAVWDRDALDSDELSFRVGDVIEVLDMTDDVWWHGSVRETSGWFPAVYSRLAEASRMRPRGAWGASTTGDQLIRVCVR